MLFSTLKKYIEKCPFTYWLNGRWFLQIVERGQLASVSIISSIPLVLILYLKCGGGLGGGGGGVMFFSHFMLFLIFLEKNIWEYKIIISHLMFCMLEIL